MSQKKVYLKYRYMVTVNANLEKLNEYQDIENKKFIENANKIKELMKENTYIAEEYRKKHNYSNYLTAEKVELKPLHNKMLQYCEKEKLNFELFVNSRMSNYSTHRQAWYKALRDAGVPYSAIGGLFGKTHATVHTACKYRDIRYDYDLMIKYTKIKEFINE